MVMGLDVNLAEAETPYSGKSIGLAAKCMIDRACKTSIGREMHDTMKVRQEKMKVISFTFSGGTPSYTLTFPL